MGTRKFGSRTITDGDGAITCIARRKGSGNIFLDFGEREQLESGSIIGVDYRHAACPDRLTALRWSQTDL
jgi:hypothetical protein